MTPEELKEKYGGASIMGVDKEIIDVLPARGMVTRRIDPLLGNSISMIERNLQPRFRCEAELNSAFKQIIPYVLLRSSMTGEIYTTARLGGDSRLKGKLSIGLGGHMDEGETIIACLLRELREEVGVMDGDIDNIMLYGYLYSDATEVDSVHLGIVYVVDIHRMDICCLEADKLCGAWFNLGQLTPFREGGLMESWSEMLFDEMTCREGAAVNKCDVCGKAAPVHVASGAYGPMSFAYCDDCMEKELEPYHAVVLYIASAGHFPNEIKEDYVMDVRRMLPMWGKTEEEFIRDVENSIKSMEETQ